jgi:hypothetical protein
MGFVRHCLTLVLAMALLVPSVFFRDCCCTRQNNSKPSAKMPMKACCQAKLKLLAARNSETDGSTSRLKNPPCQCKPPVASVAVLTETQLRMIGQIDSLTGDVCFDAESNDSRQSHKVLSYGHGRNLNLIGPPLQVTLCRWVI